MALEGSVLSATGELFSKASCVLDAVLYVLDRSAATV